MSELGKVHGWGGGVLMVAGGPVKACGLHFPFWNGGSVPLVRGKASYLFGGAGPHSSAWNLSCCSETLSQAEFFRRRGVPPQGPD